jgi:hypothetical protein
MKNEKIFSLIIFKPKYIYVFLKNEKNEKKKIKKIEKKKTKTLYTLSKYL